MKRLIKKMPHKQGLESYILAYANESDKQYTGKWSKGKRVTIGGEKKLKKTCISAGTVCNVGDVKYE